MSARQVAGWLVVPYPDGDSLARVELEVGGELFPAFLDWEAGQRVAKVRARPAPGSAVRLLVSGAVVRVDKAT